MDGCAETLTRRRIVWALAVVLVTGACTGGESPGSTNPKAPPSTLAPPSRVGEPGLLAIEDLEYAGAFRIPGAELGESNANFAVGALGHNPERNSLFIAGHAPHNAIAEFDIPDPLGTGTTLQALPIVETPRQPFGRVLERTPTGNPDALDKITGMLVLDGQLIVNAENWYDAGDTAADTTAVIRDASDIAGEIGGYFELAGGAQAAGYLAPIPEEWQVVLGGSALTGWASNYSIISRYSVGPSLFVFDPAELLDSSGSEAGVVDTAPRMVFPYDERRLGDETLLAERGGAPEMWNLLSRGVYGFIVPSTRTFAVVGSNGGIDTGIGYKITQDDGSLCQGYCAYGPEDYYNYYWFFDLDEIVAASEPTQVRPYAHGRWEIPFDDGGEHLVIGATFDHDRRVLYLAIDGAGQIGDYDIVPLIVAFSVP